MLKEEYIRQKLAHLFNKEQISALIWLVRESYDQLVKVSDFNELKEIVRVLGVRTSELANAQKKTEQRLDSLTLRVEELAEAQKRTEARVEELAEAQKRTEARVEELAEAQKRTEARVEELAEAQKKTEIQVQSLAGELKKTRKELGGLSITVGYTLENEAFKALPGLLLKEHGIKIKGRLKRTYLKDKYGRDIEVNISGEGKRNGRILTIIGEAKSQLSKRGVDEFIRKKLKRFEGVYDSIFPVLVTHMISSPGVEDYTRKKGIALFFSYDF